MITLDLPLNLKNVRVLTAGTVKDGVSSILAEELPILRLKCTKETRYDASL